MKNVNHVGKRLLALLIAVVMVFGMMPTNVRAEDPAPTPTTSVQTFYIKMSVEKVEKQVEVPPTEAETSDPTDEAGEPEEPKYETVVTYKYTGKAYSAENTELGEVSFTDAEGSVAQGTEVSKDKVTGTYTHNGMILTGTIGAEDLTGENKTTEKTLTWKATSPAWGNVYAGAAFSYPAAQPTLDAGCSVAEGYRWTVTLGVAAVDGKYYAPASGNVSVTYTLTDGTNTAATLTSEKAVEAAPAVTATMKVNGNVQNAEGLYADEAAAKAAKVWYTAPVTIQVVADAQVDLQQKPATTTNVGELTRDASNVNLWNVEKTFSEESEAHIVTLDGKYLAFAIENNDPTAKIVNTYFSKGKTYVEFEYTVGISGLKSIAVNGADVTATDDDADGIYTVVLDGNVKDIAVVVTSVAGRTSEEKKATAQDDLATAFSYTQSASYQGVGADGVTYDPAGEIVITVTGTNETPYTLDQTGTVVDALDKDGNAITASAWTANEDQTQWTCTVSTAKGLTKLEVTPKDAKRTGTTAAYTERTFGVDAAAPSNATVVTDVTATIANGVKYYNAASVNYTVSVEENLLDVAASYVTYTTADGAIKTATFAESTTGTYSATFAVPTGSHLTSIRVNAVDKAANANDHTITCNDKIDCDAPVVAFSISENVKQFYTNADGQIFAVLDPAQRETGKEDEDQAETVILTATVTDMSIESLEGWTDAGKTASGAKIWTKTFTKVVEKDSSDFLTFKVDVADFFGKKPTENVAIALEYVPTDDKFSATVDLAPVDGVYEYTFKIDRRTPDNISELLQAPEITLTSTEVPTTSSNGRELYNGGESGTITFNMNVDDLYVVEKNTETNEIVNSENDSGVDGLSLKSEIISDQDGFLAVSHDALTEAGASTITVELNGINETNEAQLKVIIADEVGNTYTYVKNFAVDNKAPEIKVAYGNEQPLNGNYYSVTRTAEISVYDLNLDHETVAYVLNGETVKFSGEGTDASVSVPCLEEGHYTLSVSAADLAKTSYTAAEKDYTGATPTDFYVDLNNPHFTVTKTVAENARYVQEDDTTEYYNGQVVYTVSLVDTYLDEANVVYTITNASNTSVTSEPVALKSGESMTIKVNNGEILTDIQLYALDLSGRYASVAADVKSDVPFEYDEETHIWTYAGLDVAVDTTPAAVTLKKDVTEGEWIQSYEDYDYYNAPLTYSIDIQDRFLTDLEKSSVQLVVEYMDASKNINQTIGDFAKRELENGEVVYSTKFEVLDGQGMKNITLQVIDNAGNATAVIDVIEDAKMTAFAFDKETKTNKYLGSTAVVDTTTPKATLTIDGNVESFYTYKGVAYVKLANPAEGMSGILGNQKDETVTLTINVTDKNLTLDSKNEFPVKNNTSNDATNWTGTELKNESATLTYSDRITVAADKTGYFKFDLTVYDLAGNAITDNDITVTPIDGTVPNNLKEMVKTNVGKFGTIISVDRRRPSSVTGDNDAPVITVTPSIGFTTSNNNKELYAGAFNFALTVTDGSNDASNSGLNSVDWVISDEVGFVTHSDVKNGQASGTYTKTFSIPVTLNQAAGESNSAKLTIVATDNVGNTTTYVKEFAVDTLAPRVTVSYDNNSVLNAKYFKADRIASIRVEDINFNAATTPITTEVPATAWVQNGDVYTATCAYTADGEYTFDMSATDKAANVSEIDFTNGGRNAAPKAFTIDKTAPVINVSYNPASPVGTDPQGVQYYDTDLGVTVTITEVNFNAAEVKANMGERNALNFWSNNGNRHTASTNYTEGNNYSFNIQYTDLAGNPATPYSSATFSVDTHAPTIEITNGDLTTEQLNIIQDDLVLGFTINDAQDNLSGYTVKVTHLNNEFQETLVEGSDYYVVNDVNNRTTVYVNFDSIESIKENDGTYNVQITASDYAGHHVALNPSLNFSLNRFGSTFMTDDEFTANFLEPSNDGNVYQNSVSNKLVIKEINPNKVWQDDTKKVEGSVITIAVNGQSIILEKDTDYTVTVSEEGTGNNKWYVYTYEIDPANFVDGAELIDGNYTVLLYGVDEAGNKNTNESNEYGSVQKDAEGEYSGKISFTLDHKAPVITTYGIETGDSIDAEFKQLNINLSDNTPAGIKVLVNGVEVVLSETMEGLENNKLWLALNAQTGEYVLNIPESNEKRQITVITTDAAGNTAEQVIDDVLITSNAFVRAINNPVIVGAVSVGGIGLIAFLIFLLKKKKNKEEQPA